MTSCFEFTAVPARPLVYPINLSLACVNKKNKTKMAGKKKKKKETETYALTFPPIQAGFR